MNIAEIYEQHYYPEQAKECRANTIEGYDSSVRLHVLPRWGACVRRRLAAEAYELAVHAVRVGHRLGDAAAPYDVDL